MSVNIIPREINAQITRTLDALTILSEQGKIPQGLSDALEKLRTITPDPSLTTPVFPHFGLAGQEKRNGDLIRNQELLVQFCHGLEQINIAAFKSDYEERHNEYLHETIDDKGMAQLLSQAKPLVDNAFLDQGRSDEQAKMLMYFSKQLSRLAYNLTGNKTNHQFSLTVTESLYEIANESAIVAFKLTNAYDSATFHPKVVATDLMELSVNGDTLLGQDKAITSFFAPLDTYYQQGNNNYNVDVDGRDTFINVMNSFYDDEITIPVAGSHTEIPKTLKQCGNMMTYTTRLSGDYKKPDQMSIMRVVKAMDMVREKLKRNDGTRYININGEPLTTEQKNAFTSKLETVLRRLADSAVDLVIPFDVNVNYEYDWAQHKKRTLPTEMLYIVSPSINELPDKESLSQLQSRLNLLLPEITIATDKSLARGVNAGTVSFRILPKVKGEENRLSDLVNDTGTSFQQRLKTAIEEMSYYAYAHDSKLSIQTSDTFSDKNSVSVLNDILSALPNKFVTNTNPDGTVTFDAPASNALSNPNGQKGAPLPLTTTTPEKIRNIAQKDGVTLYTDLDVARQVIGSMLTHNPDCADRLILAKMPVSQSTLHQINHFIKREPEQAILAAAIEHAIANASSMWEDFTENGRISTVVNECHKWGVTKDFSDVLTEAVRKSVVDENMNFGSLATLSKSISYDYNYGKDAVIHQAKLAEQRAAEQELEQELDPIEQAQEVTATPGLRR